jgi:hypothetical protein
MEPASYVVRNKETRRGVLEFFASAKKTSAFVRANLNYAKYEIVPILQYLEEFNRSLVVPAGVEPAYRASETRALSC